LLASLLGQREDTYVSPTSNLADTLQAVVKAYKDNPATEAGDCSDEEIYRTLKAVMETKYERNEPIIFDKGRMWPKVCVMESLKEVYDELPKIVATVRPMAECIASFYEIDKENYNGIQDWIDRSFTHQHLMESYKALEEGYAKFPEQFCLIEYSDLCDFTQRELDRIADFIGVSHVAFSPKIQQVDENDNAWGIKNLHTLAETIEATNQDTEKILGKNLFRFYQGGEFWNDKPEPDHSKEPLNIILEASLSGDFKKSEAMLREELSKDLGNNRAKFNLGLYEMMKGNLLRGHKLLDCGRAERCFGNLDYKPQAPLWNGESDATILMNMEGGFGDQFHCIRYAKNISDMGNRVIVTADPALNKILRSVEGVDWFVAREGANHVFHEYWVPSMSVPIPLEMEFSDVSGRPYIPRDGESEGKIGVKWAGNPKFEHEQHRLFPPELMWDVVDGFDCISLQKEGESPNWMDKANMDTWEDTRKEISKCDLVITSCTGLAHLSAGMGIETWIVCPILPYYLWALAGDTTPHYDSVRLFRQERFGEWEAPFWNLKKALRQRLWKPEGETTLQFIEA
jgi:hypothetical protein